MTHGLKWVPYRCINLEETFLMKVYNMYAFLALSILQNDPPEVWKLI